MKKKLPAHNWYEKKVTCTDLSSVSRLCAIEGTTALDWIIENEVAFSISLRWNSILAISVATHDGMSGMA